MNVAHLSDLHFGRHASEGRVRALAEDLRSQAFDLMVVAGDVTDSGTREQFRVARDFLQSIGPPFIIVPGNREICPTAIWEWLVPTFAMARFRKFFGASDRIVLVSEEHKVVFLGVNTVHGFPSWPGKLARQSRYWLKETAAGFPGYFKALVLHHPVLPVIRSSSFWAHSLSDAGEVLNICTQSGISLILQGHKHRSAVMELHVPERDATVVVSCGGAPLAKHWDPSYHKITVSDGALTVESRVFADDRFAANGSYSFPLNGGRVIRS